MADKELLQLEEFARLVRGVRSLSGCLSIVRLLEQRDIGLEQGEEKIILLSKLIEKIDHFSKIDLQAQLPYTSEQRKILKAYAFVYIHRSGQYTGGGYDLVKGKDDAQKALDLAEQTGDEELQALALNHLGNALLSQQQLQEAYQVFLRSLELQRSLGNSAGIARILYNLTRSAIAIGNYEEARETVDEALELYENETDLPLYGKALLLGVRQKVHEHHLNYGQALVDGLHSIEILEKIGMRDRMPAAHSSLVRLYLQIDNVSEAMHHALAVAPLSAHSAMNKIDLSLRLLAFANIEIRLGNFDRAEEFLREGFPQTEETGYTAMEVNYLKKIAEIKRLQGNHEEAEELFLKTLEKEQHLLYRTDIYQALASLSLEQGNLQKAEEFLEEALMLSRSLPEQRRAHALTIPQANLLHAKGQKEEAIRLLLNMTDVASLPIQSSMNVHKKLFEIYEEMNDVEMALHHYRYYHDYSVEHERLLAEHRLIALRARYELEQVHLDKQNLQKKQEQYERKLEDLSLKLLEEQQKNSRMETSLYSLISSLSKQEFKVAEKIAQDMLRLLRLEAKRSPDLLEHLREVDDGFFQRLDEQHPTLTVNQKRLCGLLRSGLTSAEIAELLHVTAETVATQRKRLRKKLGLPRQAGLEQTLREI